MFDCIILYGIRFHAAWLMPLPSFVELLCLILLSSSCKMNKFPYFPSSCNFLIFHVIVFLGTTWFSLVFSLFLCNSNHLTRCKRKDFWMALGRDFLKSQSCGYAIIIVVFTLKDFILFNEVLYKTLNNKSSLFSF